jgi:acyl carrier protein
LKDETRGSNTLREEVQQWLLHWFASRAKMRASETHPLDMDYFAAGWLTSMEVVEFVTNIESQFNMQFTDRDLQDARFATITGLAELIVERTMQTSENLASRA